jgi:hypothetical protein
MTKTERLAAYKTFSDNVIATIPEYRASKPSQRMKQPWDDLMALPITALQQIQGKSLASRMNSLVGFNPSLLTELEAITDFLPEESKVIARYYSVYKNIVTIPTCLHCGKALKEKERFRVVGTRPDKGDEGFGHFCSGRSCSSAYEGTVAQRKETNLAVRGVEVPSQHADVRAKMDATHLERHGETHFAKTQKGKELRESRFGGNSPFSDSNVRDTAKATIQERYGCDNAMGNQNFADKAGAGKQSHAYSQLWELDNCEPCFTEDEYNGVMADAANGIPHIYTFVCKACTNEFEGSLEHQSYRKSNKPRCPICEPKTVSAGESSLLRAITSRNPLATVTQGDRKLLNKSEIDILVADTKTGVEFNGLYWHSDFHGEKCRDYHQGKLEKMAEKGHRLIYVWEDEWRNSKESVENRTALACSPRVKVNADDCQVVCSNDFKTLMDAWHRDGSLGGHLSTYVLQHKGNTVALLQTVHRPSKKKGMSGKTSLRYAPVGTFKVEGDFEMLLAHVIKKLRTETMILTAELDPSHDDVAVFQGTGFGLESEKAHEPWYLVAPCQYKHRLTKSQLIERVSEADPTMNSKTTMTDTRLERLGADRVWGVKRQLWTMTVTKD